MGNKKDSVSVLKKYINVKNKKKIGIVILILFVISIVLFSLRLYNYPPFSKNKIGGIEDNQFVQIKQDNGISSLLFTSGGEINFNSSYENFSVYADYYEYGELITSKQIFENESSENNFSGTIKYGLLKDRNSILVDVNIGGAMSSYDDKLDEIGFSTGGTQNDFPTGIISEVGTSRRQKIVKNKKYYFFLMTNGPSLKTPLEVNLSDPEIHQALAFYFISE
ncbi:hypothetical protein [Enterococcus sp. LJL90]